MPTAEEILRSYAWPERIEPMSVNGFQYYPIPKVGMLPRVTSILNVLGTKTEGLMDYAARAERDHVLLEGGQLVEANLYRNAEQFRTATLSALRKHGVEQKTGEPRLAHRIKTKAAGDLGTDVHACAQWAAGKLIGLERPEPVVRLAVKPMVDAWGCWFAESKLEPVRLEQMVTMQSGSHRFTGVAISDVNLSWAGTGDVLAIREHRPVLVDYKTSRWIYLEHHLQLEMYAEAVEQMTGISFEPEDLVIVRFPKYDNDPLYKTGRVEVRALGDLGRGSKMTRAELGAAVRHIVMCWRLLMERKRLTLTETTPHSG